MKVTLVGAGPGDKGLLTLKGFDRIQNADVVLYDRHVGNEILALIPETAEAIDVGKNAGNHPVPQSEINKLLLENAKKDKNVVRLKGGDPFVFGRGGEELEFLYEHDIPFEVVPGVTSAIAGAAFAGIPVTHRDHVSSFHVVTGHGKENTTANIDFSSLVKAGGTLIFMMSVSQAESLCTGLTGAGMDENMPAAVIENATQNKQRKFIGTLGTLPGIILESSVKSPAVIIVGAVCKLSEKLDWFSKRPLFGRHVIVPRVTPGESKLSSGLRELGCHVTELKCAKIEPLTGIDSGLDKALGRLDEFSWLIFTLDIIFFGTASRTK